jgi:hypothetical protein
MGHTMNANLYETDHAAWLAQQADCLRMGQLSELDFDHLAEELDLQKLFKDSPSLRRFLEPEILDAYADAVELAAFETGLAESTFPNDCPFSPDDLLDKAFWPD